VPGGLRIIEHEAVIIRDLYAWAADAVSLGEMVRRLNARASRGSRGSLASSRPTSGVTSLFPGLCRLRPSPVPNLRLEPVEVVEALLTRQGGDAVRRLRPFRLHAFDLATHVRQEGGLAGAGRSHQRPGRGVREIVMGARSRSHGKPLELLEPPAGIEPATY
jgi:hypothetical protein